VYKWDSNSSWSISFPCEPADRKATIMQINSKTITFKKKDKDFFLVEVIIVLDGRLLQIWEVSLDSKAYKLSHWTENVGEGLPILLPS
jgi:hypothetical protein